MRAHMDCTHHTPKQGLVLSKESRVKLAAFYNLSQNVIVGAMLGLAFINTLALIVHVPDFVNYGTGDISFNKIAVLVGVITGFILSKILRHR